MNSLSRRTFRIAAAACIGAVMSSCNSPEKSPPAADGAWGSTIAAAEKEGTLAF